IESLRPLRTRRDSCLMHAPENLRAALSQIPRVTLHGPSSGAKTPPRTGLRKQACRRFKQACTSGTSPICRPTIPQARALEPERLLGHASAMDPLPPPFGFFLLLFSGWVNRHQQAVIDYLLEENRVLRAAHGRRPLCLTDDQRRRLALKARVLGRRRF